jgi:hypothetical protein
LGDSSIIPYTRPGRNPAIGSGNTALNYTEIASGILFVEDKPLSFYLKNLANGTVTVTGAGGDGTFVSGTLPSYLTLIQVD